MYTLKNKRQYRKMNHITTLTTLPPAIQDGMDELSESASLLEEYFHLTQKYKKECGERTIVLLTCGIFYEMWGYLDFDGSIVGSDIKEVSRLCNLACVEKSKLTYNTRPVYQAGLTQSIIDKYLQMIVQENGYTAVLYCQTDEINIKTKKRVRKLEAIHSPGTYISMEPNMDRKLNNHLMVLWIERGKFHKTTGIVYGMSVLNVFNGKVTIYEQIVPGTKILSTTFDTLEKNISIFCPSEIILVTNLSSAEIHKVQQYSGMTQGNPRIEILDFSYQAIINCGKQTYINHAITQQYGDNAWESCEEFQRYPFAAQSLCYLLHFVQCRNQNLIKHIEFPVFQNQSNFMILANHTLRQLNILLDHQESQEYGTLSSVGSFLNKCNTAMGKRQFQYKLTHPTFDTQWLENEYQTIDRVLAPEVRPMIEPLRIQLKEICDLEKTAKHLSDRKLTPMHMSQLDDSIQRIQQMHVCLEEMPWFLSYLGTTPATTSTSTSTSTSTPTPTPTTLGNLATTLTTYLNEKLDMVACRSSGQKTSMDENIIKPGVSPFLDDTLQKLTVREKQIETLEHFFNQLYNNLCKPKKYTPIMKTQISEKNIVSMQLTKTRADVLRKWKPDSLVVLDNGIEFDWKDLQFTNLNKTNAEVQFPLWTIICRDITNIKNELNAIVQQVYHSVLVEFEELHYDHLETLSHFVSQLDMILCKSFISYSYRYCRPTLANTGHNSDPFSNPSSGSFVKATNMRHVLIERLQENEQYVPNDIEIGTSDTKGILLYGTNAVGKTSYIRSLGICVVMAQAGMFVPCETFHYRPYKAIYSRIIGNDNLFKGLSTYAVEISELRTILQQADPYSLVLGDELCSGTETVSALSVVMASLIALHKQQTSFILASHFHELVTYDELKALTTLKLKHMEVWYDAEIDGLVYDRKIKDGSGQRTYGLEVCKSLYFPEDVLTTAYKIREKYHPEFQGFLSRNPSRYNSKKIKDQCELCGAAHVRHETHHLQEQHLADHDGFIDNQFHKNHPANLLILCEECHDKIHAEDYDSPSNSTLTTANSSPTQNTKTTKITKRIIKRKTSNGYVLSTKVLD